MLLARAKSFALGLAVVPLVVALGVFMTVSLSTLILNLGRNTRYSFETTMDGPFWAECTSVALLLAAYGATLWKLRERVAVRWVFYGTFVAPALTAVSLVVAFLALGGTVGPR
jgi:hypothetical protein